MHNRKAHTRTKWVLYSTSVVLCLIILGLSPSWTQAAVGPKMVIEEKLFNAMQVKEGDVIRHTFTVRNTGDQPLKIERVQPG